jgi:hypothetical protein
MPQYLLGRLESLPHDFFSSLIAPVVNRFDNYSDVLVTHSVESEA